MDLYPALNVLGLKFTQTLHSELCIGLPKYVEQVNVPFSEEIKIVL